MQTATLVTLRMRPTVSCTSSFDYNWWLTLIYTVLLQYTINSLKALYHFSTATTHNRPFNINNNQLKCTWLKVHTESRSYNTVSFAAIHQKLASAAYLSVKSLTTSPRWDLLLLHVLQDESNVWTGSGGKGIWNCTDMKTKEYCPSHGSRDLWLYTVGLLYKGTITFC